ncbi:MAG: tetratricopeptide repeat protein, partial [Candidatus Kapaibacterium sp.]
LAGMKSFLTLKQAVIPTPKTFHSFKNSLLMSDDPKKQNPEILRTRFEELKLRSRGFLSMSERMVTSEEMLQIAQMLDDHTFHAFALRFMGINFCIRTEYDRGIEYFQKAFDAYELAGVPDQACFTLTQLAIAYHMNGEILKSLEVSLRAIAWARELADTATLSQTLINAAESCMFIADYDTGVSYLKEALQIARAEGKNDYVAQTLVGLSEFALAQGDPQTALTYAQEALAEEGTRSKWAQWRAINLRQVAKTLSILGRWDESIPYFAESLEIYEHAGDMREQSLIHQLWGITLRKMNDLESAQSHITLAIQLAKQSPSERLAAAFAEQGEILAANGKLSEAIAALESALELATGNMIADIHESISKLQETDGNVQDAFHHFRKATELKTRYIRERVQLQIQFLAIERGFERQRQEMQFRHEQLERELANTTLQLVAHTNRLAEFRDSIREIAAKMPPSEATVRELRAKIKDLTANAIDWKKYDEQFKAAYPEFSVKLTEKYPLLSHTEVRVCALLRMNLKSEDIARLFCLSERTIENHRNHIRQKMKLQRSEELAIVLAKM